MIANRALIMVSGRGDGEVDLCLHPAVDGSDQRDWSRATPGWRKYFAGDYGSPHWYDVEAFTDLVQYVSEGESPPALGEFIGRFAGLKRTPLQTRIRQQAGLNDWQLTDLRGDRGSKVPELLAAMKQVAKPPTTASLGPLGKVALESQLRDVGHGIEDGLVWYKLTETTVYGVPWITELFVMETTKTAGASSFWLMNHSVLLNDPTTRALLSAGEIAGYGISGMFEKGHLHDWGGSLDHVTVAHLICPAPRFTDRGKTTLDVPRGIVYELGESAWAVTRKVYREWEKAVKDQDKQEKEAARERERAAKKPRKPYITEVFPNKIVEAYRKAGGDRLPASSRTVYYQARPLIEPIAGRELKYEYFKTLLGEYDLAHPNALPNLYYEARGEFVEPHTRRVIPLGTLEVAAYRPDEYLYDKILYVEKSGLKPVFEATNLNEKYDMGLTFGMGYANKAARDLAKRLQPDRDTRIFILHDADAYGYNIAIAFAEETSRMPDHHIEVVDLGLTWSDAMEQGLDPETATRRDALPERVMERLEEEPSARAAFVGEQTRFGDRPSWKVQRVELNAMSSTALVEYVEEKLRAAGADEKFFPPEEVAEELAIDAQHAVIERRAKRWLAEAFDIDAIVARLVAEFGEEVPEDLAGVMATAEEEDRTAYWRDTVDAAAEDRIDEAGDALRERFDELLDER